MGLLPSPNGYSPCHALSQEEEAAELEAALKQRSGGLGELEEQRIKAVRTGLWLPVQRRNLVLGLMHGQGQLSDQGLRDAQRQPLNIDPSACRESPITSYPFFSRLRDR